MAEDMKKLTDFSTLPALPPKPPISTLAYSRYIQDAPYKALIGIVVDARKPEKVLPRHRVRCQTGLTNRWRFPESLYSDMLGTKQALKSVNMPFNLALANHISECSDFHLMPKRCRPTTVRRPTKSANTFRGKITETSTGKPHISDRSFTPAKSTRSALSLGGKTSQELFFYNADRRKNFLRPGKAHKKHDVILKSLGIDWELDSSFLHKSEVLYQLLHGVRNNTDILNNDDNLITEYETSSSRLNDTTLIEQSSDESSIHLNSPASPEINPVTEITLDIDDPLVTQRGFAIALSHLYREYANVVIQDAASVLAAAVNLKFDVLIKSCEQIMLDAVNYKTVCQFHTAASKYNLEDVVRACEYWLELNLIPKLSNHIELQEMDSELLNKILSSSRLFTLNELSVYKTLCTWFFLELNPQVQVMPSYTTVVTFFNSLPKVCPFLENEECMDYLPLFSSLRLHGITDSNDIQDILLMNILPYQWVVNMLSQQHRSLNSGGDMTGLRAFHKTSIRQGIVVEGDIKSYSEIMSLYGFYFELKVIKQEMEDPGYVIYFQRLKPNDSAVSLKHLDRSTFSLRTEREVKYSITVQYIFESVQHIHSTGVHAMSFGLIEKTCRSQVLSVNAPPATPMYVSFAVLLPPT